MANHQSTIKRMRQTARRTEVNRRNRSRMRTQVKKMTAALEANDAEAAQALLVPTISIIDRSAKHGVLHPNKAARMKSRLIKRLKKAAAA